MSTAWIQTYTGKAFDIFDPRPQDVCIEDIAQHLSKICRFTGACHRFYSVAEHSWEMADRISKTDYRLKMAALLHDAHEAYLGDIAAPVGKCIWIANLFDHRAITLSNFKKNIQSVISVALDLPIEMFDDPRLHEADLKMLATEKRNLMAAEPKPWIKLPEPFEESLVGEWKWDWATVFQEMFYMLKAKMNQGSACP